MKHTVAKDQTMIINIGGNMKYDAVIKVEWATTFDSDSKTDFIKMCKEQWKQDFNIDLADDEITIIGIEEEK